MCQPFSWKLVYDADDICKQKQETVLGQPPVFLIIMMLLA